MENFYVYIHFNAKTKEPFYVGKGSKKRYKNISNRGLHWKRYYNKYGFEAVIIEENLLEEDAFNLEKFWIGQLKQWGFKLINQTEGGDGVTWWTNKKRPDISEKFKGHKVTKETREKISKANKGKHNSIKTEFKKGYVPINAGKSKYTLFLNNKPAENRICEHCNNNFLARIDKPTKFCSRTCSANNRYKNK